jgi:CNT family concentrative nucleoside transporter
MEKEELPVHKPRIGKRSKVALAKDLIIFLLMTAYMVWHWVATKGNPNCWFVVTYIFVSLRLFAQHVSVTQVIYEPLGKAFDSTVGSATNAIPARYRTPCLLAVVLIAIIIGAVVFPVDEGSSIISRFQSIGGVIVLLGIMWFTSEDRSSIPWHTVGAGMAAQYLVALFVLKTTPGNVIFTSILNLVVDFLYFSKEGLKFLIGDYTIQNFVINVFPAVIFFCSFIYVVYYLGGMQYLVAKMAWLTIRVMDCSGAEAVVAVASPFIGQGESALLVKPFVEFMTNSEIHSSMTSGFATIAGSILLAFIAMGVDGSILLTSCIMSITGSLLLSKMRYPEKEESLTKGKVQIPQGHEKEANFLHAATNGAATGVQIILLIGGGVLSIIALFSAADKVVKEIFNGIGVYDMVNPPVNGVPPPVSIQLILSYIFAPFAFLIGIETNQVRKAGEIMAIKMVVNEFVGYDQLMKLGKAGVFTPKTVKLMTFALCGFANVASIGIQIGVLGAIAPTRTKDFAKLALSAMLTGTVSTWLSACIAGTLI